MAIRRDNRAYLEALQNDFWNPQFADVEMDDQHLEVIYEPEHNHGHRGMNGNHEFIYELEHNHGHRGMNENHEFIYEPEHNHEFIYEPEHNHVHRVMNGNPVHVNVPFGIRVPFYLPIMQLNQAQRNNQIAVEQQYPYPYPYCQNFEEKMVIELSKSNDPEDRKQLNSIVAYIARAQKQVLCASLLNNGYNVNVLNEKNQTMLHIAFYNNSHSIIAMIMDSPAFSNSSIDYTDSNGLTHLHIVCAHGNAELAERYLIAGSKVNAVYQFDMAGESSQFTPLHFAVSSKRQHIVKLLLRYGADVNFANLKGQTPLHMSCWSNQPYANTEIMKELITNSNLNINARDNQGNTPLFSLFSDKYEEPFRCEFKIEEIEPRFDILMKLGADIAINNEEGNTVLHLLIKNLRFRNNPIRFNFMSFNDIDFVRLIKKILDANIQIVNLKNKLDETPLQLAVAFMSLDIVQLLLDYNASLDDLKIDHFYYPKTIPVFEPVRNLVSIVNLLSEKGYTFSPADNIHILTFLIHESCNCECLTYNTELPKTTFDRILHFGTPEHVIFILRRWLENQDANHYYSTLSYSLQYYSDLANTGNFYIDAEVKSLLEEPTRFYYSFAEDQTFVKSKRTELQQMASTVIKNEIKLYDIMMKNPHDITRLIKNIDFSPTFADNIPLFKDIVKGHITKALIRSYVETSTYEVLKRKLLYSLPDLCCVKIINLLSNLDIVCMYAAADPPMIFC